MLTESINSFLQRDLEQLKTELEAYRDESKIWEISGEISNSSGNLSLHLVGNLNHFIGTVIGNTGYVRQREREFSLKNVSRAILVRQIEETKEMLAIHLAGFPEDRLKEIYPLEVFGYPMRYEHFFMHLATHLSYHLGQVNYHRRLLDV